MNEPQNLKEKRKIQNRNSQRRCRSRKKANDRTFMIQFQADEKAESAMSSFPRIPNPSLSLIDAEPNPAQSEIQSYSKGIDFGFMPCGDTPEELYLDISHGLMDSWPTPSSIFSPLDDDSISNKMSDVYYSPNHEIDQAGPAVMASMTLPGDSVHALASTEGFRSPNSVLPSSASFCSGGSINRENLHNTNSNSNNTSLEGSSTGSILMHNTTSHNANHIGALHSTTDAPQSQTSQDVLSIDSRGTHNATCCVTHKAEMMISEVQALYTFGTRFGFVAEDNGIQDCLSFLRTRLREISQCPSGNVLHSNPSDGDGD